MRHCINFLQHQAFPLNQNHSDSVLQSIRAQSSVSLSILVQFGRVLISRWLFGQALPNPWWCCNQIAPQLLLCFLNRIQLTGFQVIHLNDSTVVRAWPYGWPFTIRAFPLNFNNSFQWRFQNWTLRFWADINATISYSKLSFGQHRLQIDSIFQFA